MGHQLGKIKCLHIFTISFLFSKDYISSTISPYILHVLLYVIVYNDYNPIHCSLCSHCDKCKIHAHVQVWSAVQGPLWYCVCIINSYSTLLNWPIVGLLILFYFIFSNHGNVFCILVHDYTLCFIDSPCCSVSYNNYISVWPYYTVSYSHNIDTYNQ